MSDIPADLKYTKSHEWVRDNGDGSVTVGITDHAQEALGDIVFVEAPEVGRQVAAAEACAVVESVKAASDIYAPLAGEVLEANAALGDAPELINSSAHAEGWIFRLAPSDASALDALLDAAAYTKVLEQED
ncbi:glycine cleavage system protein GcvH [Marichromatium bheemlicum]|uniref:Glycine cleavage system H protein n=1 Tax=Marichromatium bheemlicum TaxID=365339 RepID=A0ABX1I9C4_9GAMM|nr:glycine cleavage system protein GcvH [Marichromatium bheemlicum]NKN32736.1 glycine cleavage system protein GcvH [Marichromatium bheemlicum]